MNEAEDDGTEDVEVGVHLRAEAEGSLMFAVDVEDAMSLGLVMSDRFVGEMGPLKFRPWVEPPLE